MHSCATYISPTTKLSQVTCWGGHNEHAQLTTPASLKRNHVVRLSVGDEHSCAVIEFERMYVIQVQRTLCWGANDQGQAETPGSQKHTKHTLLAAGGAHSCSGRKAHTELTLDLETEQLQVACWGSDQFGQAAVPWQVQQQAVIVSLHAGVVDTCVIAIRHLQGGVACWGLMADAQAGWSGRRGDRVRRELGGRGSGLKLKVADTQVVVGQQQMCVLDIWGRVDCVGGGEDGEEQVGE